MMSPSDLLSPNIRASPLQMLVSRLMLEEWHLSPVPSPAGYTPSPGVVTVHLLRHIPTFPYSLSSPSYISPTPITSPSCTTPGSPIIAYYESIILTYRGPIHQATARLLQITVPQPNIADILTYFIVFTMKPIIQPNKWKKKHMRRRQ
uniref:Uncharacterized protein n=1 Tax=Oryza punctata TaxID=4537 RepID=A0A0E0MIR2_ORYPU